MCISRGGAHGPRLAMWLAWALALGVTGCGGEPIAKVSGVVRLDGQPAENISVTFTPKPNAKGEVLSSSGLTNADGRYDLKVTITGQVGAVVGMHRVTLALVGPPSSDDSGLRDDAPVLPPHDFSFDVPAAGSDAADFELKSPETRRK